MLWKKKPKILILGAKGTLGQCLTKVFCADSCYKIFEWDREKIDITDQNEVNEKITRLAPWLIINAAAYNAVDKCEELEEFESAKKVNGLAVGYLAEVASKIDAILVHYSTDNVFDGENKKGYKEDDRTNPINRYAETKLLGEKLLAEKTQKYYLVRTSRLFGRAGSFSKESFIDLMLRLAKEKDSLKVVDEEIACFTYAPDLAQATKDLVEKEAFSGIYHVINAGAYTWYEAALKIFKEAGINIEVIPVPAKEFSRPAKRPKYSILLNTKLPPLRSFEEALKEYLKQKSTNISA